MFELVPSTLSAYPALIAVVLPLASVPIEIPTIYACVPPVLLPASPAPVAHLTLYNLESFTYLLYVLAALAPQPHDLRPLDLMIRLILIMTLFARVEFEAPRTLYLASRLLMLAAYGLLILLLRCVRVLRVLFRAIFCDSGGDPADKGHEEHLGLPDLLSLIVLSALYSKLFELSFNAATNHLLIF